ncbi:hypothetical protein V6N12_047370 [Hibiscus sabdariffa]|uniref:Reverse transcriptase Ty1/copia-type domain-containing protein n=1 Tax=Hibiscus sabdariffa TaxID=183260 RepID=A0ABR2DAP7_9ROSI
MRIILNQERNEYVIIESVPNEPGTNPPRASKDKFEKHMDDMLDVGCLVLATITLELQKQHEYVGYALETNAFTLNRVPSKSVQKTPYEMWTGKSPNMSFMRIWGCKAYVEHQMSTKLEPKSQNALLLDIPKKLRDTISTTRTKCLFLELEYSLRRNFSQTVERVEILNLKKFNNNKSLNQKLKGISQAVEENPTDLETQPLRRSARERHEPERYGFLVTTHGDVILVDQDEPKTYQEAVASSDSEKWLEAMRSEMDSMSENQVWTLVEPPEGIKPIGCKWVFKKKTDMDGNVQTYKGRLVAKVAAFHDYEIWQMDVKTAFLNGKLEEDVYMTQPEGFVTPGDARKVCKLQRSIYGLKQASRSWNLRFNEAIQEFGFIRNEDEPCVYKKFSGSIVSFLILGFLPMRHGISLSKEMCPSTPQERERMSQIPYVSAIESIMYAMICTRPDLSYALSMTSRYQKSSKQETVVDSATKVEYVSASEATKEIVWIKKFISELGVVPSISDAVGLYCDNNGAIAQAKEPRSHHGPKHTFKFFYLIR